MLVYFYAVLVFGKGLISCCRIFADIPLYPTVLLTSSELYHRASRFADSSDILGRCYIRTSLNNLPVYVTSGTYPEDHAGDLTARTEIADVQIVVRLDQLKDIIMRMENLSTDEEVNNLVQVLCLDHPSTVTEVFVDGWIWLTFELGAVFWLTHANDRLTNLYLTKIQWWQEVAHNLFLVMKASVWDTVAAYGHCSRQAAHAHSSFCAMTERLQRNICAFFLRPYSNMQLYHQRTQEHQACMQLLQDLQAHRQMIILYMERCACLAEIYHLLDSLKDSSNLISTQPQDLRPIYSILRAEVMDVLSKL